MPPDLAAKTGATPVSVPEAVRGVDLIIVTITEKNIPNLPARLFADTPDQVVVNYYPRQRDGRIETIEAGMPESTETVERGKETRTYLPRAVKKWPSDRAYPQHLLIERVELDPARARVAMICVRSMAA